MEAKAVTRFVRISPRKAQQVMNLIRNKDAQEALAILNYSVKGSSEVIRKVLHSAIANAEHNYEMDPDNLYVSGGFVDQGPTMKRHRPRAMGRADVIRKRTSHITVIVREKEEVN